MCHPFYTYNAGKSVQVKKVYVPAHMLTFLQLNREREITGEKKEFLHIFCTSRNNGFVSTLPPLLKCSKNPRN